jgi:NAD(P)-dependent dehydrogenase (short-subunit alcohol dehydrogenase family)
MPFMAGYVTSKLATVQLNANIAAAYPSINAVNIHPGLIETEMLKEPFKRFNMDDPSLTGGTLAWLAADHERSRFLSGRTIHANWDVEGLVARRDEIVKENLLTIGLQGKFGKDQFES